MKHWQFEILFSVSHELLYAINAIGLEKISENLFTPLRFRCNTVSLRMNKRSATKTYISAWVPRSLKAKLVKLAKSRGDSVTDLIVWLLQKATDNIELTAKDYEQITEEIRQAESGGSSNQRVHRHRAEEKGEDVR
jgi:hypothetical protein